MGFSAFVGLFAVVATVAVFVLARKRMSLGAAAALSGLAFLGIAGAFVIFVQVALSGMNA